MIAAAIMAEAERIAVSAARNNAAMKKKRKRAAAALDDNHDELPGAAADAAAGPDPGPAALGPAVEMQSGRLWMQLPEWCLVVAAAVRIQMGARIARDQATPPAPKAKAKAAGVSNEGVRGRGAAGAADPDS